MGVSKNHGIPKSSILIGFSIINHPFWGTPIFGNTQISIQAIKPRFGRPKATQYLIWENGGKAPLRWTALRLLEPPLCLGPFLKGVYGLYGIDIRCIWD